MIVEYYWPLKIIDIVRVHRWFPRTHLKCMVIDGESIFRSVCVANTMANWRDTYIRMVGGVVAEMTNAFGLPENFKIAPDRDNDFSKSLISINDPKSYHNPVYKDLLKAIDNAERSIKIARRILFAKGIGQKSFKCKKTRRRYRDNGKRTI